MPRRNIFPRLKGELENRIHQLSPGDMLPGENALAAEFGVSRPTLRRALAELEKEGVIGRRNGVGTVVRSVPGAIRRELPFVCGSIDFFSAAMEHFCRRAVELNYFPMVIPLAGNAVAQERLMAGILERRPAGIVIYPDPGHPGLAAFRELERSGIPTLYLVRLRRACETPIFWSSATPPPSPESCRNFTAAAVENSPSTVTTSTLPPRLNGRRGSGSA